MSIFVNMSHFKGGVTAVDFWAEGITYRQILVVVTITNLYDINITYFVDVFWERERILWGLSYFFNQVWAAYNDQPVIEICDFEHPAFVFVITFLQDGSCASPPAKSPQIAYEQTIRPDGRYTCKLSGRVRTEKPSAVCSGYSLENERVGVSLLE